MSRSTKSSFLQDAITLFVQQFGVKRVQAALERVSIGDEYPEKPVEPTVARDQKSARPNVADSLESIRMSDPEKYHLLSEFLSDLKERKILPESQDIRHFAYRIGLKDIQAKSRKDMIPKLMRFLLERPTDRLQIDLPGASNISEQQRQQGFSVLTDKLLGER